jgi:hypothetical protein
MRKRKKYGGENPGFIEFPGEQKALVDCEETLTLPRMLISQLLLHGATYFK